MPSELVRRLIERRYELGWTQLDLANAMGLPQPSIAYFETRNNCNIGLMERHARALGLEMVVSFVLLPPDQQPKPRESRVRPRRTSTHCANGHELIPENRLANGRCRLCERAYSKTTRMRSKRVPGTATSRRST